MVNRLAVLFASSLLFVACTDNEEEIIEEETIDEEHLDEDLNDDEENPDDEEIEEEEVVDDEEEFEDEEDVDEDEEEENVDAEDPQEDESSSEDFIELNETLKIGDGETVFYELTVVGVTNDQEEFPQHMLNLEEYDTERMIIITIEYENINYTERSLFPHHLNFEAITTEGESFFDISQQTGQEYLQPGESAVTSIYFEFPKGVDEVDDIELIYSYQQEHYLATFALPVD